MDIIVSEFCITDPLCVNLLVREIMCLEKRNKHLFVFNLELSIYILIIRLGPSANNTPPINRLRIVSVLKELDIKEK